MTLDARLEDATARAAYRAAAIDRNSAQPLASGAPAPAELIDARLLDEALRRIVREELAALPTAGAGADRTPWPQPRAAAAPPSTAETARRLDDIRRDIGVFASAGAVSESDLASLELQIAQLPPTERAAALSELSRVMSASGFNGRY